MSKPNRGAFKPKTALTTEATESRETHESSANAHLEMPQIIYEDQDEQTSTKKCCQRAQTVDLESRLTSLESKLDLVIDVLLKEMSGGLKQGPEGLARAIRNSVSPKDA